MEWFRGHIWNVGQGDREGARCAHYFHWDALLEITGCVLETFFHREI